MISDSGEKNADSRENKTGREFGEGAGERQSS